MLERQIVNDLKLLDTKIACLAADDPMFASLVYDLQKCLGKVVAYMNVGKIRVNAGAYRASVPDMDFGVTIA